ncbi:hypothetical protein BU14_0072s0006 [Porphyra umbilicalis]|uniref:Diphthamide biosynthesis protein 4 n=1 Tax=Porphyra umbilicalis TaxID=2786 RepID=A0A1X6PFN4_PORUM|nr:hypothetical protein BU14_0072s0006 [Porphyra umbilicalis]|eukprot:OSX79648.1 hypothetical protein BU14_0072s0006 [Porphyra umbilicalis]
MNGSTPTHYDVLGVRPNASAATIRRAYLAATLRTHPDRRAAAVAAAAAAAAAAADAAAAAAAAAPPFLPPLPPPHPPHDTPADRSAAFVAVTTAASVLGDAASRAAYDARLAAAAATPPPVITDTVGVEDLAEGADGALVAPCRCGGGYAVPDAVVAGGGVVACDTCSLAVRVVGEDDAADGWAAGGGGAGGG